MGYEAKYNSLKVDIGTNNNFYQSDRKKIQ